MSILKEYEAELRGIFSDWIQIKDLKNPYTLDDFSIKTGVVAEIVKPHCVTCTTVNQCWFKNEPNKKPDEMEYESYSRFNRKSKGLYHPYCHCIKKGLNPPKAKDITLDLDDNKLNYFFRNKGSMYYAWGYLSKDKNEFINTIKTKIVDSYIKANYMNGTYRNATDKRYGFRINIFITIEGKNQKKGSSYDLKSGYIVYPNGKIRNLTPLVRSTE